MKTHLLLVLVGASLFIHSRGTLAAGDADRQRPLRFPQKVAAANPYVETDPDPDYRHASEAAYRAFRDIKYGVRIHWGLYSMLPAARESWTFLEMNDAQRQAYQQMYKNFNPRGFDAEQWM